MQGNRKVCAAVSALLITGVAATAAHAADPAPAPPKPCTTASFLADPFGDSLISPTPVVSVNPLKQPGADNMDLGGFYLTSDENGTAFVNIKLKNASLAMPAKTTSLSGLAYYFSYRNVDGVERFVSATISNDPTSLDDPTPNTDVAATDGKLTFGVGNIDTKTGSYSSTGSGAGTLFPGANGVVQIQLPDVFGGDTIGDLVLVAAGRADAVAVSSLPRADEAPDGADPDSETGLVSYDVPECVTPATTASAKKTRSAKRSSRKARARARARR
jgi:hypothetical protein